MSVQEIPRDQWTVFFDTFTRMLVGKTAEVEVASLDLGDQIEAEWLPLIGISYDKKNNLVAVIMDGLDHMILAPRSIYVDFGIGGLVAVEVVEGNGTEQIIKLKDELALPAPNQVASREAAQ